MAISPEQLLARLDELGIATTTHKHPPLFTVEDSQRLRGDIPGAHAKNLFLKCKKDLLWLVVAEENTPIDLKTLHQRLGSGRLSFGKPDLLQQTLGVAPGSVTPFALINDAERRVNVILDDSLLRHDRLNFHPLTNEATTGISRDGLLAFIRACGHEPKRIDLSGPAS
jgi:Ala-tRNA(Pro) deacylase